MTPAGLPGGHRLVSVAERPELWAPLDHLCGSVWPELMLHDPVAARLWHHLPDDWPALQLALLDGGGEIVAGRTPRRCAGTAPMKTCPAAGTTSSSGRSATSSAA